MAAPLLCNHEYFPNLSREMQQLFLEQDLVHLLKQEDFTKQRINAAKDEKYRCEFEYIGETAWGVIKRECPEYKDGGQFFANPPTVLVVRQKQREYFAKRIALSNVKADIRAKYQYCLNKGDLLGFDFLSYHESELVHSDEDEITDNDLTGSECDDDDHVDDKDYDDFGDVDVVGSVVDENSDAETCDLVSQIGLRACKTSDEVEIVCSKPVSGISNTEHHFSVAEPPIESPQTDICPREPNEQNFGELDLAENMYAFDHALSGRVSSQLRVDQSFHIVDVHCDRSIQTSFSIADPTILHCAYSEEFGESSFDDGLSPARVDPMISSPDQCYRGSSEAYDRSDVVMSSTPKRLCECVEVLSTDQSGAALGADLNSLIDAEDRLNSTQASFDQVLDEAKTATRVVTRARLVDAPTQTDALQASRGLVDCKVVIRALDMATQTDVLEKTQGHQCDKSLMCVVEKLSHSQVVDITQSIKGDQSLVCVVDKLSSAEVLEIRQNITNEMNVTCVIEKLSQADIRNVSLNLHKKGPQKSKEGKVGKRRKRRRRITMPLDGKQYALRDNKYTFRTYVGKDQSMTSFCGKGKLGFQSRPVDRLPAKSASRAIKSRRRSFASSRRGRDDKIRATGTNRLGVIGSVNPNDISVLGSDSKDSKSDPRNRSSEKNVLVGNFSSIPREESQKGLVIASSDDFLSKPKTLNNISRVASIKKGSRKRATSGSASRYHLRSSSLVKGAEMPFNEDNHHRCVHESPKKTRTNNDKVADMSAAVAGTAKSMKSSGKSGSRKSSIAESVPKRNLRSSRKFSVATVATPAYVVPALSPTKAVVLSADRTAAGEEALQGRVRTERRTRASSSSKPKVATSKGSRTATFGSDKVLSTGDAETVGATAKHLDDVVKASDSNVVREKDGASYEQLHVIDSKVEEVVPMEEAPTLNLFLTSDEAKRNGREGDIDRKEDNRVVGDSADTTGAVKNARATASRKKISRKRLNAGTVPKRQLRSAVKSSAGPTSEFVCDEDVVNSSTSYASSRGIILAALTDSTSLGQLPQVETTEVAVGVSSLRGKPNRSASKRQPPKSKKNRKDALACCRKPSSAPRPEAAGIVTGGLSAIIEVSHSGVDVDRGGSQKLPDVNVAVNAASALAPTSNQDLVECVQTSSGDNVVALMVGEIIVPPPVPSLIATVDGEIGASSVMDSRESHDEHFGHRQSLKEIKQNDAAPLQPVQEDREKTFLTPLRLPVCRTRAVKLRAAVPPATKLLDDTRDTGDESGLPKPFKVSDVSKLHHSTSFSRKGLHIRRTSHPRTSILMPRRSGAPDVATHGSANTASRIDAAAMSERSAGVITAVDMSRATDTTTNVSRRGKKVLFSKKNEHALSTKLIMNSTVLDRSRRTLGSTTFGNMSVLSQSPSVPDVSAITHVGSKASLCQTKLGNASREVTIGLPPTLKEYLRSFIPPALKKKSAKQ